MLRSYLRLVLFGLGLLIGVQWPGFIEAYALRVDAHRQEAEIGLQGFRETAEKFFQGDLNKLVTHYRASDDPVIRSDARSLEILVQRVELLDREWQAMNGPWYARAWHVAFAADSLLRAETYAGYRYQVLLTPEAITWGLGGALLLSWLVELVFLAVHRLLVGRPRVSRFS
ncbi:DUF2937 family protein [Pseudomonas sp. ABC1]|uniref:DUF2937 family protein n=1 Tax=Pseudomonas sp. ABC1 TaxID=2748080 RepID=UPI0015C408A0|nr:DUF2937 family protein [Pseudomonas sp. ABC1]QLF91788.1 DUF2937 family protein [Pseudomonas sp. ABC1]